MVCLSVAYAPQPTQAAWSREAWDMRYMRHMAHAFPRGSPGYAAFDQLQKDGRRYGFVVASTESSCSNTSGCYTRAYLPAQSSHRCSHWLWLILRWLPRGVLDWSYQSFSICNGRGTYNGPVTRLPDVNRT